MVTRLTVRNGDVDIAVFEEGNPDGEVVLLLHGWPDSHHLWRNVVPYLTDRFRVVSVDNRGHGESTDPPGTRSISVDNFASDYAAVIDAVSPNRPVHVLAHDWGSVAFWEVVTGPDAVRRVASFNSVSGPSLGHVAAWARTRLRRPTPRNLAPPLAAALSFSYSAFFALPVLPKVVLGRGNAEWRWRRFVSRVERVPRDRIALAPTFKHDIVSGLRIYRTVLLARRTNPLTAEGLSTKVPVQCIIGKRDPAVRQSCYADEALWADRVWLRVVRGGHWLPFSHPELLAGATIELIDEVSGAAGSPALERIRLTARA
ncbi:alpha/beta fold hydrolase [Aldersonia sp. NBC_00410]|uniref:alpha/beta fold hydrolase n=1 Tax=Aldersonia sp. NBC_00410 TaxID=2975954 RepID=UPI00225383BE|nr:alpha/beta fold hydrolase [Aldersonia sp. NBC_00410]MCX5043500.1 alpha/beta fold hydrolase [Aldersonia sp. NBC_00410]